MHSIFASGVKSPLENPWIFNLGFMAGQFCVAMFIHTTFYRGRRSPTGLNSIVCFYAIRSAVGKKIGTEDSEVIGAYIQTMTYSNWDALLQNPELRRVFVNGGVDKVVVGEAINNVRQPLVEKQSLLTLSTR